ncbi:MAG: glycosyl hydrolase 53 family protein [Bacteroidales bacterium]
MRKKLLTILSAAFFLFACSDDNRVADPEARSRFAKGADVSWVTEMEASKIKFYDAAGNEKECMKLMKSLGMNSLRLRVWVDPVKGWNNKQDVLLKAFRAHALGMRLMIDFHYSDSWADPGQQNKPAAWKSLDMKALTEAVASHTADVLSTLKANGIEPEWVQVGNETGNGMLWEEGRASEHMDQYAVLNNAGYDAVKRICPNAKVIVHLQNGGDSDLFQWLFDGLKRNGGKWDVIGMSLYPTAKTWQTETEKCLGNARSLIHRYGCEVMICEVGMSWDEAEAAYDFLSALIAGAQQIPDEKCLGVFYWEPQSYGGWNGYSLGAFDNQGRPTVALDAFK